MAALTNLDGYEHGVLTTLNQGYTLSSPAPTVPAAAARTGGYGLRSEFSGTGEKYITYLLSGTEALVASFFARMTSHTSGSVAPFLASVPAGLVTAQATIRLDSGGNFKATVMIDGVDGTVVTGPAWTANVWHRVDARVSISGTVITLDWTIDGAAQTSVTNDVSPETGPTFTSVAVGGFMSASKTLTVDVDDFVASRTSGDYPLGEYQVKGYMPNGVGTHNLDAATSEYFWQNTGSDAALTSGDTTSHQTMDELPLASGSDFTKLMAKLVQPTTAPTFQSATNAAGSATGGSITLPTTAADDILILVVINGGALAVPTRGGTYSGGAWTEVNSSTWTTGYGGVFWSRCTGNHTGQTVTLTGGTNSTLHSVVRYSGCETTDSPIGRKDYGVALPGNETKAGVAATYLNNAMVVCAIAYDDNQAWSVTKNGTAMTERVENLSSTGADVMVGLAELAQATAGSPGDFVITQAAGTAQRRFTSIFELIGPYTLTQSTNTWYTEYTLADSAESVAPAAVKTILHQEMDSTILAAPLGGSTTLMNGKARAGGNETDLLSLSSTSAPGIQSHTVLSLAPGSVAWTDALFDGLTIRLGYSSDSWPPAHTKGIMVEAAFPASGPSTVTFGATVTQAATISANFVRTVTFGCSVAGQATITAQQAVSRELAATVAGAGAITVGLSRTLPFAASIAGTGAITAQQALTRNVAATIAGTSALTAQQSISRGLAATVAGQAAITAQQAITRGLAASVAGQAAVTAQADNTVSFGCTVAGQAAVTANASNIALFEAVINPNEALCNEYLAGQFVCGKDAQIVVDTTVERTVTFDAAIAGSSSITVQQAISREFAASVAGQAAITAQQAITRDLAATVAGQAAITAQQAITVNFGCSVAGAAAITAQQAISRELAASVAGQAAVTADTVRNQLVLAADVAGVAAIVANTEVSSTLFKTFDANIAGQASIAVNTVNTVTFGCSVAGQAAIVAQENPTRGFAASVAGVGAITVGLGRTLPFASTVAGVGALTVQQAVTRGLAASIAGSSSITAQQAITRSLAAVVAGQGAIAAETTVTPAGFNYVNFEITLNAILTAICGEKIVGEFLCGGTGPQANIVSESVLNRVLGAAISGQADIQADQRLRTLFNSAVSGQADIQVNPALTRALGVTVNGQGQIVVAINLDWLVPTTPGSWILVPTTEVGNTLTPTAEGTNVLVPTTEVGNTLTPTAEGTNVLVPTVERTM